MSNEAALVDCLKQMSESGLSEGSSGNASVRVDGGMLISPTGFSASQITETDLVFVDNAGKWPDSRWQPSSEWHFHMAVYQQFPETGAIVHCHSRHATALACQRQGIPQFHYMVAVAGGRDIRCADYALFGSEALADSLVFALRDRKACLMANHGQIALGETPAKALQMAGYVEDLAAMYLICADKAVLLTDAEMDAALLKFEHYGRQPIQE